LGRQKPGVGEPRARTRKGWFEMKSEIWNLESPQVRARSARLKTLFCLARQTYRSSERAPGASKRQK
jgi:hypothetical protein